MELKTMPTQSKPAPKIALKAPILKAPPTPAEATAEPVSSRKPLITLKKTPPTAKAEEDSSTMDLSVDEASTVSEVNTYVMPVYGVNMRLSLDNKYIYDMDFNLVGTVLDDKSIEWIEDEE